MSRKKVNERAKVSTNVRNNDKPRTKSVYIDFSKYDRWAHSFSYNGFSNKLKNGEQLGENLFYLINQLIPEVENNLNEILNGSHRHCHRLDDKHCQMAKDIINHHFGIKVGDVELWQFGVKQGLRLIGEIVTDKEGYNVLYPLLIDYHHLIYPDQKHNTLDIKNYKFVPQDEYN
ncbi:hypothetical protein [Xylocopilactobacillus apis]|uniref:Uncharacterized protein n=1 Tax=Xylocopilactobacillus apis TaxID=2932183 RepID=A0AAU9D028_9LACO|nr:hypothetical protein [Xylocopilactobacillus apis]BDR56994.1 hypothetical protein KIMC2_15560 [Xylocopilactobacillus apis]